MPFPGGFSEFSLRRLLLLTPDCESTVAALLSSDSESNVWLGTRDSNHRQFG